MAVATIRFKKCLQDSQELGSDNEHMVSAVYFDIEAGGRTYPGLMVTIKQLVGDTYEGGAIEVGMPEGYSGPMNWHAFQAAVERYYRQLVGSTGGQIGIGPGSKNARMYSNRLGASMTATFEYE